MAIYHCSIKIVSRGRGKSAVAAAAYRAGAVIKNEYDGVTHDYSRKGGIAHTEIMLPDNAPAEYKDRVVLWNAVEKIEKAKNSQLAREIEIALPIELNHMQNLNLIREYVRKNFVEHGMCADIAIHGIETENPHAHILLTMRPFNEDRTWGAKFKKVIHLDDDGNKIYNSEKRTYKYTKVNTVDWDNRDKAEEWREAWGSILNQYLEQIGHAERVDHRSFDRQGITDRLPTIHLGVAAHQMEKRGIKTERGDINREIVVTNNLLRQLNARISKLEKWIDEESKTNEPPTLADVISEILNRREQSGQSSRYGAINNLKQAAAMLNFLQENKIMDLDGLHKFIISMHNKQSDIREKLKPMERRLKTLDKHIEQAEYYREFTKINRLYNQQKPKDKEDFFESHRRELTLYQAAERYIKTHLNGRDKIPLASWEKERVNLTVERKSLNAEYLQLNDEVGKVEKISRSVQDILYEERRRDKQQIKSHGIEL
ncbi:MAG: MobA/MobL family protein [Oscillospiraceae bacterium]|nr:MobA/MobL family protein [Oscillospiraceae bacterium]